MQAPSTATLAGWRQLYSSSQSVAALCGEWPVSVVQFDVTCASCLLSGGYSVSSAAGLQQTKELLATMPLYACKQTAA